MPVSYETDSLALTFLQVVPHAILLYPLAVLARRIRKTQGRDVRCVGLFVHLLFVKAASVIYHLCLYTGAACLMREGPFGHQRVDHFMAATLPSLLALFAFVDGTLHHAVWTIAWFVAYAIHGAEIALRPGDFSHARISMAVFGILAILYQAQRRISQWPMRRPSRGAFVALRHALWSPLAFTAGVAALLYLGSARVEDPVVGALAHIAWHIVAFVLVVWIVNTWIGREGAVGCSPRRSPLHYADRHRECAH